MPLLLAIFLSLSFLVAAGHLTKLKVWTGLSSMSKCGPSTQAWISIAYENSSMCQRKQYRVREVWTQAHKCLAVCPETCMARLRRPTALHHRSLTRTHTHSQNTHTQRQLSRSLPITLMHAHGQRVGMTEQATLLVHDPGRTLAPCGLGGSVHKTAYEREKCPRAERSRWMPPIRKKKGGRK
jgi:hypothetical protein